MLGPRILTAIVLVAVLLGALLAPVTWPFTALMGLIILLAAWEWSRLSGYSTPLTYAWAAVACAGCVAMSWGGWPVARSGVAPIFLFVMGGVWIVAGAELLHAGVPSWSRIPRGLRMLGGLCALWAAWLAAVALIARFGAWYLVSVLALAWAADIAAYFAGRAFGRRKLAPTISPGKSWAGVVGGQLGVLAMVALVVGYFPRGNFYSDLMHHAGWLPGALLVMALAAMSVVGDLIESLMKRSMGMKDSSHLLPGHGGVLDRIDALLPILPLSMALVQGLQF